MISAENKTLPQMEYSVAAFVGGMSTFWISFKIFFAQASSFYVIGESMKSFLVRLFITVALSFAGGVMGMLSKDVYTIKIQPAVKKVLNRWIKKRKRNEP